MDILDDIDVDFVEFIKLFSDVELAASIEPSEVEVLIDVNIMLFQRSQEFGRKHNVNSTSKNMTLVSIRNIDITVKF